MPDGSDVLVVGGGIIGLAIAQPLQILISSRRAFCVFSK
jgi:L-2-hydroxyglutarate oxidase LhgO